MSKGAVRFGLVILAAGALALCAIPASAQVSGERAYFRGFYIGGMFSSLSNPTFRQPGGYGELPVPQSASGPAFMLGYDIGAGGFGLGARALYFHAAYQTFAVSEFPSSPYDSGQYTTFIQYADPGFTHISLDLLVHWLPFRGLTLGIYGLLGMASSTEKYVISGSSIPEFNGSASRSEFDYSYGLGLRFSPVKMVSFFGEYRLIPGDLTTEYTDYLYSDDVYNYYGNSRSFTENTSGMFSFGLSVNF